MKTVNKNIETKDFYQQITDQIIAAMSQSTDWVMPWHGKTTGIPKNVATKKSYTGVNILALWSAASDRGYSSPLWGTYKQWQSLGAQVRKGEKAQTIVFYKSFEQEAKNAATGDQETGKEDTVKRFILKASTVFNADQVEGLEISKDEKEAVDVLFQLEKVEAFIAKIGAKITYGSTSAFYQISDDLIAMPEQGKFIETETRSALEAYYGTLLHELGHWTGHQQRLNRIIPSSRFGSQSYAIEELVAELASAFLCAELGVSAAPRQDHANYIANWLNVLKDDKRAIFYAARQATVAVEYLNSLTQEK